VIESMVRAKGERELLVIIIVVVVVSHMYCLCRQRSACWLGGDAWPVSGRPHTAVCSHWAPSTSPVCWTGSPSYVEHWSQSPLSAWRR